VGRVLADRYVLKRQIGEGGFGVVFEAEDRRLGRRVAAKVLSAHVAKSPTALARFETEAKAAAQIGHQGIVDVRDFGSDGATHFIIMELIDGVDLTHVIRDEAPLPLVRCLSIAARVAQALAVAHDHGIVHRDLKPGNIVLTRIGGLADFAKVLDFGISKITEEEVTDTPVTETGTVIGTPRYMAPEQGIGTHRLDHRVDIYALGVILYELATREVPFAGSTAYETLHLKALHPPRLASEVRPALGLPAELDALLMRALDRDPERRFASMWELDIEIRRLLGSIDPAAAALVEPTPTQIAPPRKASEKPRDVTAPTKPITLAQQQKLAIAKTPAKQVPRSRRRVLLVGSAVLAVAASFSIALLVRSDDAPSQERATLPEVPQALPVATDANRRTDELVELRLDIEPRQATIELDGTVRTDNPLRLTRGADAHQLTVAAPGFVSQSRTITATQSGVIVVHLELARPARVPTKTPASRKTKQRFPDTPIEPK
jgi:eukaryotic-like serine/threonine-protein kinase